MNTYLVTGGAGFIGSHLADSLIAAGHRVLVLDNLSTGKKENLTQEAELIVGDITDIKLVNEIISKVDGCFHLAAIASVEKSNEDWLGTHAANLTGTINIFNAARNAKNNAPIPVVYTSSAAIYGDNDQLPLAETAMPKPLSAYAADKLSCEFHGRVAQHVHAIPNIGLRLFNVYGPRQDPASPYSGVISIFFDRIRDNQAITIFGDGNQSRDFIYVLDVVNAFRSAMEFQQMRSQVFNVCTGEGTTVNMLADTISKVLGNNCEKQMMRARIGDVYNSLGDPRTLIETLGCNAKYSLEEGLKSMV